MTALACGAGCGELRRRDARVVDGLSGSLGAERYVDPAPEQSDAPAIVAHLATTQSEFERLLREDQMDDLFRGKLTRQQERFERGQHFWTVLVAATRGESLRDYRDARLRDGAVAYFVEPYGDSVWTATLYHSFALWRLADGAKLPERVTVEFRPERYTGEDG